MSPIYYQPSGKYDPFAPVVIFILSFILASITGVIYVWISTIRDIFHVDIVWSLLILTLALYLNSRVTSTVVEKFKIRNPEMVFKVGLVAASVGWVIFNTVTKYILASEFYSSFLEFIYARAINGYPVIVLHGRRFTLISFTAKWFVGIPIWLLELLVMPWALGLILKMQTARPFSEKTGTWHRGFVSPYTIVAPPKKEVRKRLKQGEADVLLAIQPDKYLKITRWPWGWGQVTLFVSETNDDDDYYLTTSGWDARLLSWLNINKEFRLYLKIEYEAVVSLIRRFGFDQDKKFAALLQKLKIES